MQFKHIEYFLYADFGTTGPGTPIFRYPDRPSRASHCQWNLAEFEHWKLSCHWRAVGEPWHNRRCPGTAPTRPGAGPDPCQIRAGPAAPGQRSYSMPPVTGGVLSPCNPCALPQCAAANGTSIETALYGTLIGIKVLGVKRRGPATRFGLKLD